MHSPFFYTSGNPEENHQTQYNRKGENYGNYEKSSSCKEGRNQEGCTQESRYKEKITEPGFLQKGRVVCSILPFLSTSKKQQKAAEYQAFFFS